jgi:hypothetical protein
MNIFWRAVLLASVLPSAAACLLPAVAWAARIDVGTHTLLPNTPGQVIEIYLEPSDPVDELIAMDFGAVLPPLNRAPLADDWLHHPSLYLPWFHEPASNEAGPVFTEFDISGPGTVFHEVNTGVQLPIYFPRLMFGSIVTPISRWVHGEGVLARLTIDTTGVAGRVGEELLFPLTLIYPNVTTAVWAWGERPELFMGTDGITDGYIRIAALPENGADGDAILPEPEARSLAGFGGAILAIGVYVLRRRRLALN